MGDVAVGGRRDAVVGIIFETVSHAAGAQGRTGSDQRDLVDPIRSSYLGPERTQKRAVTGRNPNVDICSVDEDEEQRWFAMTAAAAAATFKIAVDKVSDLRA